jgi:hypothetical protein
MRKRPAVISIDDIPEASAGAPLPAVLASGVNLTIAYYGSNRWRLQHQPSWSEHLVAVRFTGAFAHRFGWPNCDVVHRHTLHKYGLQPYQFARVEASPWIEDLRSRNSDHPHHDDAPFLELSHIVMPFHDELFEVVARGYEVSTADADGRSVEDFLLAMSSSSN